MEYTRREFLKKASLSAVLLGAELSPIGKVFSQFYERSPNKPRLNGRYLQTVYDHKKKYIREGKFEHSNPEWQEIRRGLYFTRITVYRREEPVDSIGIVKAEPAYNKFRIFHDHNRKTIEEWMKYTKADVVFNSSYYQYSGDPCGLIISDGKMKGPKINKAMTGMFVAEPNDENESRVRIIDLKKEKYDPSHNKWNMGVQSFPLLVNEDGKIGGGRSDWYANRTVLCDDNKGNAIALTTEGGYFSLYDIGLFLKESRLGIKNALNMDGGYEGDMMIKTKNIEYLTYGQWETQGKRDISVPGAHIILPTVISIFPRK